LQSFASQDGCPLRHTPYSVPGVSSPMLYIGALYATFAWHVEDHWLCSINYHHAGGAKVWYGVPAAAADGFETAAAETVYRIPCEGLPPGEARRLAAAEALMKKTTMFSPRVLRQRGVAVYRAVQDAGSFVVTFPRAYHSGFSTGFNVGEAVNFATGDWWPFGEGARRVYRAMQQPQIIAHELALMRDALDLVGEFGSNQSYCLYVM
jgi:JmjC domain, hydroxylase